MKEIGWLHFSDLHVGCNSYKWLWPTIKKYFFEDLKRQHEINGPWEFVVFSGDMTFSGIEFSDLEKTLIEIWDFMAKMGSTPLLIPVPGNHDLKRPEKLSAVAKALEGWSSCAELRQHFWEDDNNEYRKFIESRFTDFQLWIDKTAISVPCMKKGLLPGDFTVSLQSSNGINIGFVGLNTSFLQLRNGMPISTMTLQQRQIHELLGDEYSTWFNTNDLTILVSHHDQDWLDKEGKNAYYSAINPPSTFSAHFCGHVHESTSTQQGDSGSTPRLTFKAPALFGPEKWGEAHDRIHGYICGKFVLRDNCEKSITIWPRKLVKKNAGHYKVEFDQGYDATSNEYVTYFIKNPLNLDVFPISMTKIKQNNEIIPLQNSSYSLDTLPHFPVYEEKNHLSVRLSEQKNFIEHLRHERCAWITADWGLGKDGFIRSSLSKFSIDDNVRIPYYLRIACDDVLSNDDLLQVIEEICHIPIQELCNRFSDKDLFIILDNISPDLTIGSNLVELERLFETILDYSLTFYIIPTTRLKVQYSHYYNVLLNSLDIPEVRIYMINHQSYIKNELDSHFVDRIHSLSQGFPLYIDVFLKVLNVSSLEDIYDLEIDMSLQSMEQEEKIPRALKCAVSSLVNSSDDYTKRSYALLQVLSVMSNGEIFNKIKRFYNSKPFHLLNVTNLVDLSLLEAIPIRTQTKDISPKILPDGEPECNKLLRVPRQVRDYVRSLLTESEEIEINKVAADILFGSEWRQGKIKMSGTNFSKRHGVRPIEIGNEHTIAKTLISTAIKNNDSHLLNQAALLGRNYCSHLLSEDRFKDGMIACEELVHSLAYTDNQADFAHIKLTLAKCYRMLGKQEESLRILHDLIDEFKNYFLKEELSSIYLNIALIKEKQSENNDAIDAAKKVQSLSDKGSDRYNQAAAIIINSDKTHNNKSHALRSLESKSRKNNQCAVANNICLDLAVNSEKEEKLFLLNKVIKSDGGDYYNRVRAIVARVNTLTSSGDSVGITNTDCLNISLSYSYLFSQRFTVLFNRCHEAIWNLLVNDNQHDKLLKLFRHSSFFWRIRGDFEKELEYLTKLQAIPTNLLPEATPEFHYLTSRLSSISTAAKVM